MIVRIEHSTTIAEFLATNPAYLTMHPKAARQIMDIRIKQQVVRDMRSLINPDDIITEITPNETTCIVTVGVLNNEALTKLQGVIARLKSNIRSENLTESLDDVTAIENILQS